MGHEGHSHDAAHGHEHGHGHDHRHGPAPSGAVQEHKAHAPAQVSTFVITCSDSRGPARDESGRTLFQGLEAAGHPVVGQVLIPDDAGALRAAVEQAAERGARAVLITGGTGIGRRDVTVETLRPLFEKELPGFGELFRALSFQSIGSPAMLSRATAGTYRGMVVFALPGSPQAVKLALDALILPELGHAVREISR